MLPRRRPERAIPVAFRPQAIPPKTAKNPINAIISLKIKQFLSMRLLALWTMMTLQSTLTRLGRMQSSKLSRKKSASNATS